VKTRKQDGGSVSGALVLHEYQVEQRGVGQRPQKCDEDAAKAIRVA
jgi:hypothetical protein